jgi:hypothetical protein
LAIAALLQAAAVCAAPIGRVADLSGSLVAHKGDGRKLALAVESEVHEGDTLVTYDDSRASIRFRDGGIIVLKPATQFRVRQYGFEAEEPAKDQAVFALLKGGLRAITGLIGKRRENSYSMQTATATIGIRGTDYAIRLCSGDCGGLANIAGTPLADGLHVEVLEGRIFLANQAGGTEISAGQFGFVGGPAAPPVSAPTGYHDPHDSISPGECTAQ